MADRIRKIEQITEQEINEFIKNEVKLIKLIEDTEEEIMELIDSWLTNDSRKSHGTTFQEASFGRVSSDFQYCFRMYSTNLMGTRTRGSLHRNEQYEKQISITDIDDECLRESTDDMWKLNQCGFKKPKTQIKYDENFAYAYCLGATLEFPYFNVTCENFVYKIPRNVSFTTNDSTTDMGLQERIIQVPKVTL
ncbi:hypothetical protein SSS_06850 [Sarcoptes scabiei]|uniref:Uncharacterized protein n=1 Tax=Sarcoptes scabiei TaxID=52283 RepID=A0A834R8R5_SARSC|nr:hypothetical protein SSS_06850 [Sarcoptes scabiei]